MSNITRQNILKAGLIIIVSFKKKKKKKKGERERKKIQFGIVCFLAWFRLVLICLGSQGHYLFENIHNLRVMENYKCSAKK